MFDPYGIYTRSQRKTHTGQIIRKKPVALKGSVSQKDYNTIKDYAEALGYQLIPLALNPFPEETIRLTDIVYQDLMWNDISQLEYTLVDVARIIKNVPSMQISPSLAYTLDHLQIYFIMEMVHFDRYTVPQGIEGLTASYSQPNLSAPVELPYVDPQSQLLLYESTEGYVRYHRIADANTPLVNGYQLLNRVNRNPGPISYIYNEWADNEALDVYNAIFEWDPDIQPGPIGLPYVSYFSLFKNSDVLPIKTRFHVTVTTSWTHTVNSEWIAQ